ncbi:uncharacterized protein [Sinocyclocheilus grahami]|uniref:uncharacterized protein isoform X1 n=1 Tax=Sinocyclocheilus grahami TaxID=75366 RepID=UPI0007ACAB32|nr:PREDICTED: uncharacterized protein LOC107566688 isoform X1 [Sinocyclocheilus grahami]
MGIAKLMLLVLLSMNGVFGVETDPVEIRELMEGDSVVLDTKCITKLQKDDKIVWKFGSNVIATIKANNPLLYDTDDARFKDKLQINDQTGDLTIRNTRTTHSGFYEVNITNITHTTYRRFSVTVLDAIPTKVSVTAGESALLQHNIADIHIYDVIEWKFEYGETPIAQINKQNSKNPSYNEADERFRDRLQLDQTGSLTITNTRTTDSGLYKLQVQGTNIPTKHRKFRVTVDESGLSIGIIVLICVCVIALILVVVGIYCRQRSRQGEDKGNGVQDPLKGQQ